MVIEEAVDVMAVDGRLAVVDCGNGGGLEVGSLRVLTLALVGVLVPAERLRCREVTTTVVALELPCSLASSVSAGGGGGSVVFGGVVFFGVMVVRDFDAKQADAGSSGGRLRARTDEGEL